VALSFRNRKIRKGRASGRSDWRRNGVTHCRPSSYDGFQAPRLSASALSSRRRERSRPRSSRRHRRPPGWSGLGRREPQSGQASGDDTGCPRCSKEGISRAGIAGGTFASGPRPMSHGGQSPTCSEPSRARSRRQRLRGPNREWSSRERRPRDRSREGSQKAWLLARALITLGTLAMARRKSGRRFRTRTEAAASRGGGSRAPAGVPVRRSKTYGRCRSIGFQPPRSV